MLLSSRIFEPNNRELRLRDSFGLTVQHRNYCATAYCNREATQCRRCVIRKGLKCDVTRWGYVWERGLLFFECDTEQFHRDRPASHARRLAMVIITAMVTSNLTGLETLRNVIRTSCSVRSLYNYSNNFVEKRQENWGSNPGSDKAFLSSPQCHRRLWFSPTSTG
jgi:hypothetical protein